MIQQIAPAAGRTRPVRDVTAALGNVPIVRLNRLDGICDLHDLYLKLEACNPGGSIKEKNAAFLIADAEAQGLLGASTGAIVAAGLAQAHLLGGRQQIVMVNPDRGDRYLETVFDHDWLAAQGIDLLADDTLADAIRHLEPVSRSVLMSAIPESLRA